MKKDEEAEKFLQDLKAKIKVFDLIIAEREKNRNTMSKLEIYQSDCKKHILALTKENYFKGPTKDKEYGNEYWEFGKEIKGSEVYIKINFGKANKPVICISFHIAEHKIKYRFKI
ncbi:MAG: type II toxin-antitoxin system MqsR family toxin [Bacteroidetes bacterium]|nr:type II toxin-antitoxin system MqsR family toxin [Bacteroidota bacterium]